MAFYFEHQDVALKHLVSFFLKQSREEREHAWRLKQLENYHWVGRGCICPQDIRKPDCHLWENGLKAMKCALHLERSLN